jgi:hypothetical protein
VNTARLVVGGLAVVLITVAAAIGGSYALGLTALHNSDRNWCPILELVTAPPPHATRGQLRGYAAVAELRRRFGC